MKIGSDFEIPVYKGDSLVLAHTLTSGTKSEPQKLSHGMVQWDNVMLEFNTKPAADKSQFIGGIRNVMREYRTNWAGNTYQYVYKDTVPIQPQHLSHQQVRELGCSPSHNAWTGKMSVLRKAAKSMMERWAGFHWHIDTDKPPREFIKLLDIFVGLPVIPYENKSNRRNVYGRAGEFRVKDYGVEWRVPSSSVLSNNKVIGRMYDSVLAVDRQFEMLAEVLTDDEVCANTQKAINEQDIELAKSTYKQAIKRACNVAI